MMLLWAVTLSDPLDPKAGEHLKLMTPPWNDAQIQFFVRGGSIPPPWGRK